MELREIPATPFRCFVNNNTDSNASEGRNVFTIGFKDGLAVVQQKSHFFHPNKPSDTLRMKKVAVKIDPVTKRKFIIQQGKKIELVTQVKSPTLTLPIVSKGSPRQNVKISTLKSDSFTNHMKAVNCEVNVLQQTEGGSSTSSKSDEIASKVVNRKFKIVSQTSPHDSSPKENTIEDEIKSNIIIKKSNTLGGNFKDIFNIKPAGKLPDNIKYQVMTLNLRKTTIGTMTNSLQKEEKECQTIEQNITKPLNYDYKKKDSCTQTDFTDFDELVQFIVGNEAETSSNSRVSQSVNAEVSTNDQICKFNFFSDMNKALNFDRAGNLPIHENVMLNDSRAVKKSCIILNAIRENVNIFNKQNYSALHLAILHNVDVEITNILLRYGADIDLPDPEGNTAIHLAIEHKRTKHLQILVKVAKQLGICLDSFNHEGFTPLILACMNLSFDDAKLLLDNGADANLRDLKSGRTALFHAAELYNVPLVELLMEHHADTKIRNFFGTSAHDAMFEIEEMPLKIKFCILGREHQRMQSKKRSEPPVGIVDPIAIKKSKLQTTPVLRKI